MPLVSRGPHYQPYFVYHAPVNEKTKELRKKFDMDEETGYPRAYNWRNLARLGQEYRFEDPYLKFNDYDEKSIMGYKVYHYGVAFGVSAAGHLLISYIRGYKWYARPHVFAGFFGSGCLIAWFLREKTLQRQAMKNGIDVEYAQAHPERFGLIYRPKLREVLFENLFVR